ncbi:MAG: phytanoyl-CoA dioxygenase family protein [Acidimicrobiales bacterium]
MADTTEGSELTDGEVERFVDEGFLHLEGAFPSEVAAACVDELWTLSGVDRSNPASWTRPVVRIEGSGAPPLVAAINTPRLCGAIDQLVGSGRWQRRVGYGTFPVRFPSEDDPGDAGWHVDGSFEIDGAAPPFSYGLNLRSRQRALLLLMLYTDVGPQDAPTRIRVGSHRDVARALVPFGEAGGRFTDVTEASGDALARPVAAAVGRAGDAYLCHPFLMHSASWPHRGSGPRFLGQPAIHHDSAHDGYCYERADRAYSPCERAVREALGADR